MPFLLFLLLQMMISNNQKDKHMSKLPAKTRLFVLIYSLPTIRLAENRSGNLTDSLTIGFILYLPNGSGSHLTLKVTVCSSLSRSIFPSSSYTLYMMIELL